MFSFGRENTGLVAKWWRNVDKQILFLFNNKNFYKPKFMLIRKSFICQIGILG